MADDKRQIEGLLAERNETHGDWGEQALLAQSFKRFIRTAKVPLSMNQAEGLEMIFVKISRILSGTPNHKDHWDDIAGYATLVAKEMEKTNSRDC